MDSTGGGAGRAVVLLSGGLDSGVSLARWLADGNTVALCLTLDYGQRAAQPEQAAAQRLADRFGLPATTIALPWLASAAQTAGCALHGGELPEGSLEVPGDAASAAAVWVPARNVVFLSIAAALAEAHGADHVVAGFNREEAATFPDNSAGFVAAMNEALASGTRRQVAAVAPTIAMDKVEIVTTALELGLAEGDFWSCYEAGPVPCGRCESCLRSRRAWDDAATS